jgi:hypothetical protein
MGADLRREPPGHLGHRRQQRQAAARRGDGFVGDAGGAAGHQVARLREIRRQVQVGKQHLAGTQLAAFVV